MSQQPWQDPPREFYEALRDGVWQSFADLELTEDAQASPAAALAPNAETVPAEIGTPNKS